MKRRLTLAAITLLLTIGLSSAAAYADTISLTLTNPTQTTGSTGGTLLFDATISAPGTNKAGVFLNGDDFTVTSPLTLDDIDFFLNFPAFLSPGQSVTDVLFTVTIPAGSFGSFPGSFTLLGGSDGAAQNILASQNFVATATPEPSTFLLIGTGLFSLAAIVRSRRSRSTN
jgi:hypothetical protein